MVFSKVDIIRESSLPAAQLNLQLDSVFSRTRPSSMGSKQAKPEKKEELLLKIVPPLDRAYTRWLARDLDAIYGFTPRNPRAIRPPDHYIEYMRLNGWLDLDMDDPDLAHLFK